MKRIFLILTAFTLAFSLLLSGCSCTMTEPLNFNQNFAGGQNAPSNFDIDYKEVLTYKVERVSEYNTTLKKESSLDEKLIPKYENGSYKATFYGDVGSLPSNIQTDINYTDSDIHRIVTEFSIDTTVNGKTYTEQILSEAYFYSANYSFAPIYSRTILKNAFIRIDVETQTTIESLQIFEYVTKYNQNNYVQTKKGYLSSKNKAEEINAEIGALDIRSQEVVNKLVEIENEKTYNYSIKQAIDNVQLIFAIRNLDVKVENSNNVPTISPTYGTAKTISVSNKSESTKDITLNYNGNSIETTIPVKNMSFVIGGTDNSGSAQYLIVQKDKTDKLPYKSLPIEYAETLVEYSSFFSMGALKYSLTSVEIVEQ